MTRIARTALFCLAAFIGETEAAAGQWVEPECQTLLLVDGTTNSDTFGWLVLPLGDVNGDGVDDFATSAPLSAVGAPAGGKVTAHSGANGAVLWTRTESVTSSILGYAMEVLDWNGDGSLDVLAAAPFAGASGGHVRVFSGLNGATLFTYASSGSSGDGFGSSLATRGDFDGDGLDDVAIGAPGVDLPSHPTAGRVYVFSGATSALMATIDAPVFAAGDIEFGIGLAFLGDVSSPPDGRDELVITYRHASFPNGGAVAATFNGTSTQILWTIDGVAMDFNLAGNRCDGGHDIDGDGNLDFLVGATQGNVARVYSGINGALIFSLNGEGQGGSFGSGHMVPDADGDGRADLVLGASSNSTGGPSAGKTFLYSGRTGLVIRTMTATVAGKRLGREVRAIGDMDRDGVVDYAIGGTGGGTTGPPPGRFAIVRGISPFEPFCTSLPNSTGAPAQISASGTSSISLRNLRVSAGPVPNSRGLFLNGSGKIQVVFGEGYLCVAGGVRRGAPLTATANVASYVYDGSDPAHDLAPFLGTQRHFQYWFRDGAGGGSGFNTSDGVSIHILP